MQMALLDLPGTPAPERAAHLRRVEELTRLLSENQTANKKTAPPWARDLCAAFDEAVEFAAWEGKRAGDAIEQFFSEGAWGASQPDLKNIVGSGRIPPKGALPVLPRAARRLLRTTDEQTSAAELEQIAQADPVLAGRVIGTANSVRFGSRFEIVRLRDAIMRLGVPEARKALIAACFGGLFASSVLRDLWDHSQQVADIACELAAECGEDPESGYIAGLLHDIGRLGFLGLPASLRVAEQDWLARGFPLVYAESILYGSDHAEAGAGLLKQWELPERIVEAVALHHRPEASESRLVSALYLAEERAAALAQSPPEDLWSAMRTAIACQKTGLNRQRVEALECVRPLPERRLA